MNELKKVSRPSFISQMLLAAWNDNFDAEFLDSLSCYAI